MLKLYNSLTCENEIFKPFKKGKILIYVCGITPYDTTHLGHAFTYVSFDVLIRYLKYRGFKINYTQNVTDIDDDILKKAKEEKKDWRKLGGFWTDRFLSDMKILNVLSPTHFVKATDSVNEIIKIIENLLFKNIAYKSGGNIYFDVSKDKDYGKLSKYSGKQMKILLKERGGDPDDPNKRNPLDFILWQASKSDEPFWNAPFGKGRPGWHIECCAMVNKYLGDQIDIHGGGKDLIFPHHESEIALSESYTGKKPFARFFLHAAMVLSCGEKMSKSLENLVMVRDLLKKYSPNTIRWYLLSHHYRNSWEYMDFDINNSRNEIEKIEKVLKIKLGLGNVLKPMVKKFEKAIENDIDTPKALELITDLSEEIIKNKMENLSDKKTTLLVLLNLLGFDLRSQNRS